MEPILCTQPRRFAVVAIARMVAKARNCDVGGEIGYHIGHSNVSDMNLTRIVFKTAGVLLEQLRDKGLAALKYKVIILDEVHERSVESDLLLACVKQFMMKNNDMRVVLMSATADITRYRDYFKDLGRGERIEVIAIPSASQHNIFQRKVLYLEQVAELLEISSQSLSNRYCSGPSPATATADMQPEVHKLIHKLILHLHENEADIEKSILVFLPTYHALEQQWILLKPLSSFFKVHILHRSIDTDQAFSAMRVWRSHRKVILATNIAESSVTIPGVAFVIDSCRSLQVFWDTNRKMESAELVWVSKSQAEQRKGRTGRTCDGQIYRLVTRAFYNDLEDHEYPAILRLSLRQQVLLICCAGSKTINDPKVLLQKALDPPDPEIVEDALRLLVHIKALGRPLHHRGRYEPTFYGRLLDSLPLSFDASVLTLRFGETGLLREGILLSILMDVQPLPILQPFGHQTLFTKYVDNYFRTESSNTLQIGKKETILMGNLCAFHFWQRVFKDKHRLERLKQIVKVDEFNAPQVLIPKLEGEWCLFHNLVQTSLHNVSEIYEDIIDVMHRFRPGFIVKSEVPSYFGPYEFNHVCLLQSDLAEDVDAFALGDENHDSIAERKNCLSVPCVSPNDFQAAYVAEKLTTIIREMRVQYAEYTSLRLEDAVNVVLPHAEAALCRFFLNGLCSRGSQCSFSHSLQAKRPVCKFFLSLQGCRNGDLCFFSHGYDPRIATVTSLSASFEEDGNASSHSFLQLLPGTLDGRVLVLNDKDLYFSSNLSCHYDPSKIIVANPNPYSSESDSLSNGMTILWNVGQTCQLIMETKEVPIPWRQVKCVLWFADMVAGDASIHYNLLQKFFEYLAIRILADTLYDVRVIVTMNNIRFAQLQVEKLAGECFFFLIRSFPFDESSFGKFSDVSGTTSTRPMQMSKPISYVFDMHPPTDIQFGNYAAVLHKGLHNN